MNTNRNRRKWFATRRNPHNCTRREYAVPDERREGIPPRRLTKGLRRHLAKVYLQNPQEAEAQLALVGASKSQLRLKDPGPVR